jgi:hypothetical protein
MNISPTRKYTGDRKGWFDNQTDAYLDYANDPSPYDRIKFLLNDLLVDFPGEIEVRENKLRGVDVEPYGDIFEFTVRLSDGKSSIDIKSSPTDFSVRLHSWHSNDKGGFIQDTGYWPAKKKDAIVFYGWMKDNSVRLINIKDIRDIYDLWDKLDVSYNSH